MQFNFFVYVLALAAIVHGAAIGVRSPMWAQMAKPKPGNPPSAIAPPSGQASVPIDKQWSCRCPGGRYYGPSQVALTVAHANSLAANTVGPATDDDYQKYPHTYGNNEQLKFPLCEGEAFYEFPLKSSGMYAGGKDKGDDRVVYAKSSGKFCGCIYHITRSKFDLCQLA